MDNTIKNTLKDLWFNEKEIKIYLTSLAIGQSPSSILGQKHNLPRTTANYICKSLVEKWIMSMVPKWNSFLFSPENPDKLLVILNKQQEKLNRKLSSTKQVIGNLKSIMNPYMKLPTVKYFTWVDGIIELLNDVLLSEYDCLYWALEIVTDMNVDIEKYVYSKYVPQRIQQGKPAKIIFNDNWETQKYSQIDKKMNRESIFVNRIEYPLEWCMHIYGDKVAFYSYKSNDLTGILIENKNIKNIMLSIFRLAWESAETKQ